MKYFFLSFLSFFIITCNVDTSKEQNKNSSGQKNISFTDNLKIVDNWTMCSSSGNEMMEQYNICPTISFLANGTGFVYKSGITTDRFSWTLKKNNLNIFPNDIFSKSTFYDTFYLTRITREKDLKKLVISSTKNDNQFYLSK